MSDYRGFAAIIHNGTGFSFVERVLPYIQTEMEGDLIIMVSSCLDKMSHQMAKDVQSVV